ncbi:hypothetical protein HSBAA_64340 [Vreelandella sulfidaeris]|uniref:PNPLA domain-containing protein n=1 Tax=Vreelandella sulfidaeris TaxID=115553 RepID=A0A455ULA3_9GAMM|nr:hypothetical protein HSBAA_64340 [Halomonas sulfidaeris]
MTSTAPSKLHPLAYVLACLGLCTPLLAQAEAANEPDDLPALAAASEQASVVGVSSGGYMATS